LTSEVSVAVELAQGYPMNENTQMRSVRSIPTPKNGEKEFGFFTATNLTILLLGGTQWLS